MRHLQRLYLLHEIAEYRATNIITAIIRFKINVLEGTATTSLLYLDCNVHYYFAISILQSLLDKKKM